MDIAFVSYKENPDFAETDLPVVEALSELKISSCAAPWDDKNINWEDFGAVILRSCWDYHTRPEEFERWIGNMETAKVNLWNQSDIVRWNLSKWYLEELQQKGIRILDSRFVQKGYQVDLPSVLASTHWEEFVVKPIIGASAYETWKGNIADIGTLSDQFAHQLQDRTLIVQQYSPEVGQNGEWSLIYFGGEYSHTILKRPAIGEWRTQGKFGTTFELQDPPEDAMIQAKRILDLLDQQPLYARVDGVMIDDHFTLMELELIEPSFFFEKISAEQGKPLARRFAGAIKRIL